MVCKVYPKIFQSIQKDVCRSYDEICFLKRTCSVNTYKSFVDRHKELSPRWTAHIAPCVTVWWAEDVCSHRQESHIKTGIRNCYFVTARISDGFCRVLVAASALGLSVVCPSHCVQHQLTTILYAQVAWIPSYEETVVCFFVVQFFASSKCCLRRKSYLFVCGPVALLFAHCVNFNVRGIRKFRIAYPHKCEST